MEGLAGRCTSPCSWHAWLGFTRREHSSREIAYLRASGFKAYVANTANVYAGAGVREINRSYGRRAATIDNGGVRSGAE